MPVIHRFGEIGLNFMRPDKCNKRLQNYWNWISGDKYVMIFFLLLWLVVDPFVSKIFSWSKATENDSWHWAGCIVSCSPCRQSSQTARRSLTATLCCTALFRVVFCGFCCSWGCGFFYFSFFRFGEHFRQKWLPKRACGVRNQSKTITPAVQMQVSE